MSASGRSAARHHRFGRSAVRSARDFHRKAQPTGRYAESRHRFESRAARRGLTHRTRLSDCSSDMIGIEKCQQRGNYQFDRAIDNQQVTSLLDTPVYRDHPGIPGDFHRNRSEHGELACMISNSQRVCSSQSRVKFSALFIDQPPMSQARRPAAARRKTSSRPTHKPVAPKVATARIRQC